MYALQLCKTFGYHCAVCTKAQPETIRQYETPCLTRQIATSFWDYRELSVSLLAVRSYKCSLWPETFSNRDCFITCDCYYCCTFCGCELMLFSSQNSFEFHRLSKHWVAKCFSAGQLQAQAMCFDERTTSSFHCVISEPFICSCLFWSKINYQVQCIAIQGVSKSL